MGKSIKLYAGEVTLEFDDAKHAYFWLEKGLPVAGVTSILRVLDKPALVQWAANSAVEYIYTGWRNAMESDDGILEPTAFAALCQEAKTAHRKISKAATDIGSVVHKFAEQVLVDSRSAMPSDSQAAQGAAAFLEWFHAHTIEPIHIERMVFSRTHFYAGTVDLFGKIDGELCVLDFKTSGGLYLEMPLQLAAYAVALEEETQERIDNSWIIRLDKKTGKPTPYYIPLRRDLKDAWLRVREAHRAVKRVDELLEEVKEATKQGTRTCLTTPLTRFTAAEVLG